MATMKIARAIKGICEMNGKEREARSIAETKLMWIPGARPVNVPARMPSKRASK